MKKNKLKIGIIGLGKRGKTHTRIYQKNSQIEISAMSDVSKDCGITIPGDVVFFKNYEEMINMLQLDAVSICVPPCFHYEIAKKCINKGIKSHWFF